VLRGQNGRSSSVTADGFAAAGAGDDPELLDMLAALDIRRPWRVVQPTAE
jgi:hypothetical protein